MSAGEPAAPPDRLAELRGSAKGWHGIQLAALGFIGLCGVIQTGDSTDPRSLQVLAGILVLVAFGDDDGPRHREIELVEAPHAVVLGQRRGDRLHARGDRLDRVDDVRARIHAAMLFGARRSGVGRWASGPRRRI